MQLEVAMIHVPAGESAQRAGPSASIYNIAKLTVYIYIYSYLKVEYCKRVGNRFNQTQLQLTLGAVSTMTKSCNSKTPDSIVSPLNSYKPSSSVSKHFQVICFSSLSYINHIYNTGLSP